jgi:DNA polymerase-3 subunit alpha
MGALDEALRSGEQSARSDATGQTDIFGLSGQPVHMAVNLKPLPEWSDTQRLAGERETLGLYLTGHPIAPYEQDLRWFASGRIKEFALERPATPVDPARSYVDARSVKLAGLILEIRRRGTRVSFVLDDRSGRMEVTLFEEVYQRHRDIVVKDALVQVDGGLRFDEFSDAWRLQARQVIALEAVRERLARSLVLSWPSAAPRELLVRLQGLVERHRGGQCGVQLRYRAAGAMGTLAFGEDWKVRPTRDVLEQLEALLGPGHVQLRYHMEIAANEAVG